MSRCFEETRYKTNWREAHETLAISPKVLRSSRAKRRKAKTRRVFGVGPFFPKGKKLLFPRVFDTSREQRNPKRFEKTLKSSVSFVLAFPRRGNGKHLEPKTPTGFLEHQLFSEGFTLEQSEEEKS